MLLKTMKLLACLMLLWANIIAATLAYRLVMSDATPVWMTPQEIEDAGDQPGVAL